MARKHRDISTGFLYYFVRVLVFLGLVSLIAGLVFLILYFINPSSCACEKISLVDTSFVLISLGLGLGASAFSVHSIRKEASDKNAKSREDTKDIFTFYKNIKFSKKYNDVLKVVTHLTKGYEKEYNKLFKLFLDSPSHPKEFFAGRDNLVKNIMKNGVDNVKDETIKLYDSYQDTLKSENFKQVFEEVLYNFEELSLMCINLMNKDHDVVYYDYVTPFIARAYRLFFPFVHYYGFYESIMCFTLFSYQNKIFMKEDSINETAK